MVLEERMNVIIVGAGISGLFLANCFLAANINFIILEKESTKKEYHGSDFYLSPNGIRALDQLGIWNKIKDKGVFTEYIDYIDKNGNKWATIDWRENEKRYGYPVFSIVRQKLLIELWNNINDENIHIGKKVIDIEQTTNNIKVFCQDSSSYEGDFIVGADGAFSKIRKLMYEKIDREILPVTDKEHLKVEYSAIFGVSKQSPNIRCNGRLEWHIQPNLSYFLHVQPNNEVTWFLGENSKDNNIKEINKYRKSDIVDIKNKYKDLLTNHNCKFGDILDRSIVNVNVNLEEKLFETWHNDRIVLIGDSVHKLLPFAAQGANQAIEDCVVLTNCLYNHFIVNNKQKTISDLNNCFKEYQDLRKPRVKKMLDHSRKSRDLINIPNIYYKMMSKLLHNFLPNFVFIKMMDERYNIRPILVFKDPPKINKTEKYIEPSDYLYSN